MTEGDNGWKDFFCCTDSGVTADTVQPQRIVRQS